MMNRSHRAASAGVVILSALSSVSIAAPPDEANAALHIERSARTGLASFVTARDGGAIPMRSLPPFRAVQPADFLREYGALFGVTDPEQQLVIDPMRTRADAHGFRHTTYRQVHRGVEVFAGVVKVHQDAFGAVTASNGHFFPIPATLNTQPTLSADRAVRVATSLIDADHAQPEVEVSRLVIVDPGWYGDPPAGAHLAYHIVLRDLLAGVHEAFFIDAHHGKLLDRWTLLHSAKDRTVFDDSLFATVRTEGGLPTGDFDADAAYDYSGDMYDFLFRTFGRDSVDGFGATMESIVHLQSSSCPNAFGGGTSTFYCDGIVTDDIVAHEFGHGLTNFTADLIYQHQPGQLNESFSDVWGEVVDLLNGDAAFAGPPGGTPWPMDPTHVGPGTDTPNNLRTGCVFGTLMTVNAPGSISGDYGAQPASFGPTLTEIGTTGDVVVADPVRACDIDLPFTNAAAMNGKIVVVDRGDCFFTEKVLNAQDEGAMAVIVVNHLPVGLPPMGGADPTIIIPSVGISRDDGDLLKNAILSETVNVTLRRVSVTEVRWLVGEDSSGFGGAIRDMWMPSCKGHPDTANHPLQVCNPSDGGGVHSGSGVPNHAFAILTDGKTFNDIAVNGIGLFKAAAVWYRALTVYLTPASDFQDAYFAFNAAANDLIGSMVKDPRDGSNFAVFTSADAAEVDAALLAVEMNTRGRCGDANILDTAPPQECDNKAGIFADDFESGVGGWTVSVTGPSGPPTPYNWVQRSSGLPFGRTGTVWFGEDRSVGDCGGQDESAVHSLFSPAMVLPGTLESPTLAFTHFVGTETFYDGGNVKIRVDGGAWQLIPNEAFFYNTYNGSLHTAATNTNPLAGQQAFTGSALSGGGWGRSLVDLSGYVTGGETIEIRFDLGKDGCAGADGWYVDDFELYHCSELIAPPDPPGIGDGIAKSRYLSITPTNAAIAGVPATSLRVTVVSNPLNPSTVGDVWWAGPEQVIDNTVDPDRLGAPLQCTTSPHFQVWTSGQLDLFGVIVVPGAQYEVQHCTSDGTICSDPLLVSTGKWGDTVAPFGGGSQPNFGDINAIVAKFQGSPGAPVIPFVDLAGPGSQGAPNLPNAAANFLDINLCVSAFQGSAYPYTAPACP